MNSSSSQALGAALLPILGAATSIGRAAEGPVDLPASAIIQQAAEKYASLGSYSDEGTTVAMIGDQIAVSNTFTVKLARTNLYQIAWWQGDARYFPKGVVWSTGQGDFLWLGKGFEPRRCTDREMALGSATGISGGAAASVPGTFFKMNWGNQLGAAMSRKADASLEGIRCFVLTRGAAGRTNTLWIGKQDLLIRQIENDTSGRLVQEMIQAQAKRNPQLLATLKASGSDFEQDIRSVETHRNIVLNPPLAKTDVDFHAPPVSKP